MAKLPASLADLQTSYGPHPNYVPVGGWQNESRESGGPAGEDALLLLRPAVRHSAQGPRQHGHRIRALGRVSVQSGQALSEGRQALPAIEPSGPPARSADAHGYRIPRRRAGTKRSTSQRADCGKFRRNTARIPSPCSAARR